MSTKTVHTPAQVERVIKDLIARLEESEEGAQVWAEALLRQAQGLAESKPTPQARMAAQAMGVQSGTILSLTGGDPSEVAVGSEFGSSIYRQFGPRNPRGYWLLPSAGQPSAATIAAGEDWLDSEVEGALRHGI